MLLEFMRISAEIAERPVDIIQWETEAVKKPAFRFISVLFWRWEQEPIEYQQGKNAVQVILCRKLALLILKKFTDPEFGINDLNNGISKIFPVAALIREFFRKPYFNGFRCILTCIPFFCDLLKISYRIFIFVQVVFQISKVLYNFMLHFPIDAIPLDKRKLSLVSLFVKAFLKVQKITSWRILYHCFTWNAI